MNLGITGAETSQAINVLYMSDMNEGSHGTEPVSNITTVQENPPLINSASSVKTSQKHLCSICKEYFATKHHLYAHKNEQHDLQCFKKKIQNSNSNSFKKITCEICLKSFSKSYNLKKHKKRFHNIPIEFRPKVAGHKCSECLSMFISKVAFMKHLTENHGLSIPTENMEFKNMEQFEEWKLHIENETSSCFLIKRSYMTKSGIATSSYDCHRAHNKRSKISHSTGKRRMKKGGSISSEYFCPASIVVQQLVANVDSPQPFKITYVSLHLGHECDAAKKNLNKAEKAQIAERLAAGMSFQEVLFDISQSNTASKRLQMTTMQDLRNVARFFCKKYARNKLASSRSDAVETSDLIIEDSSNSALQTGSTPIPEKKEELSLQQEARESVVKFANHMRTFSSDEQCKEIIETMKALRSKCLSLSYAQQKTLQQVGFQGASPKRKRTMNKSSSSSNKMTEMELLQVWLDNQGSYPS